MSVNESVLSTSRFPLDNLGEEAEGGGGEEPPGGSTTLIHLALEVERQEQTQWCWAAVAVSVARCFDSATHWRQCVLADAELGQAECCDDGGSAVCNVPWYLDRALERVNHLRSVAPGGLDYAQIYAEVVTARPVCARIGWIGGDGHFVAIAGIREEANQRFLRIGDPLRGTVEELWSLKTMRYMNNGSWTHTFFTRS